MMPLIISYDNRYDLYIFDINVPNIDGLDILKSLRVADDATLTIFISAKTDLKTVLKGFEAGAYDFIKKPFYFRGIALGDIGILIFEIFITNIDKVVTKEELYKLLDNPTPNALKFHISNIKKLTDLNIQNIRGIGYILKKY